MASPSDDIAALRHELDGIDRTILAAAARRSAVVERIADAKRSAAGPLFDRRRERSVYERARRTAAEVGLPADVARDLMQVLVEGSHRIQEDASGGDAEGAPMRLCIVGGGGRMGRRLGRAFAARGHAIDVVEAGDERAAVGAADVVIVAVPMDAVVAVVEEIGPLVRPDALLCDINSLKRDVCAAMTRTCRGETMGLHPMFGPTVHSLRRQKVVVCPGRDGPRAAALRAELERMGMELIESDPAAHDRMMALVQVLVHFSTLVMGEALKRSGVSVQESLRFTSPIYRLELAFVGRLFAQSPELYADIEMTNHEGPAMRRCFLDAARHVESLIDSGDRAAFGRFFDEVHGYFREFADEAMELSDFIIDEMVKRP